MCLSLDQNFRSAMLVVGLGFVAVILQVGPSFRRRHV